jgi:succinoglycan biosynthesis transport protein ExoP
MELIAVIRLFRKWLWLLVLGAFLVGGLGYFWRSSQSQKYQASVIVAVGTTLEIPNPDASFITTGEDLARTYALLATTHEVLEAAIEVGGYPVTPNQLRAMISAYPIAGTALIEIDLTYTDPVLAADIANEVARQLINKSPSNLSVEQQAQLDLANAEIVTLTEELKQIRGEIKALDEELQSTTDPDEMRLLREQRYTLTTIADEKSRNIAEFTKIVADFQQRTNSLTIVQSAQPLSDPTGIRPVQAGLVGAVLGVLAAAGIVLLREQFDDRISSSTEAAQLMGLPIFATISRFGRFHGNLKGRLVAYYHPEASTAEEYRALRTNLLYHSNGTNTLSTYIITSPGENEGKTVTTANLAVTMALAGLRVLLIDADLRNPMLHRAFDLENEFGLSTLVRVYSLVLDSLPDMAQVGNIRPDKLPELERVIQETNIPGLGVITSGPTPMNPSELLGSNAMQQWVRYLQSIPDIDIVLIDTPPVLSVTDASVLAASGTLPALLVIHARKTRSAGYRSQRNQSPRTFLLSSLLNVKGASVDLLVGQM